LPNKQQTINTLSTNKLVGIYLPDKAERDMAQAARDYCSIGKVAKAILQGTKSGNHCRPATRHVLLASVGRIENRGGG
jgi:hypothetical protein